MSAISYRGVTVAYPDQAHAAIAEIDLEVRRGEVLLVVGGSASGKSTLLRCANGLVPHTTGGRMAGDVVTFGRSVREARPRDLADVIGFVHQDPESQFVTDRVEADVAFVLENLGADQATLRRRVEEALDALGVAHLRDRPPAELSGGERQRCAIAGALAAAPEALVLDEPTSQLDPQGAEDVLAAVARLNADLGTTIVLAEHRLERAAGMADRVALLEGGRLTAEGDVRELLSGYAGAAPVTHLGRLLGWTPTPLTVREARAHAGDLTLPAPPPRTGTAGDDLVTAKGLSVRLGGREIFRDVDVRVGEGEIVALLGRNGAGKTTLLRALAELQRTERGVVTRAGRVAFVPQDPSSLLFATTVRAELRETLRLLGRDDPAAIARALDRLGLSAVAERHPRSLSGGERQRVAVAAVAVGEPEVLLLDEPTRGIDADSRDRLEAALRAHAAEGGGAMVATHDVELAARIADRVIVLGAGEVLAEGPARDVLAGSLFAPQVLRVLPPFLSVDEVAAARGRGQA